MWFRFHTVNSDNSLIHQIGFHVDYGYCKAITTTKRFPKMKLNVAHWLLFRNCNLYGTLLIYEITIVFMPIAVENLLRTYLMTLFINLCNKFIEDD